MRLVTPDGDDPRPPSRRMAIASLFTAGYALATGPANAQAVTTTDVGLIVEEPKIEAHGGYPLPLYVARPVRRGRRHPAILVVNEIFGIHAYIKDVCRRLAHEGYCAVAPDYFDRAGDPSTLSDMADVRRIVEATPYEQVMGDTAATLAWLARRCSVMRQRIGITGFCWGGAVVWMAASQFPAIKAGVAWYGRLTAPPPGGFMAGDPRPWPVDIAATLQTPVLGLYAEHDQGIPLDTVEQMRAALNAADNPSRSEIIVYPGAQHGFHADYRASYNAEAAQDGWTRALAWLRQHGVG